MTYAEKMQALQRRLVTEALCKASTVTGAAKMLGMKRTTLIETMKRLGIAERGSADALLPARAAPLSPVTTGAKTAVADITRSSSIPLSADGSIVVEIGTNGRERVVRVRVD